MFSLFRRRTCEATGAQTKIRRSGACGRFVGATVGASCVIGLAATAAIAQVHLGDVILTTAGGGIVTNRAEGLAYVPTRVFGTMLGESSANFTDEPGFDCEPGTFPVPSSITFSIRKALRQWSGQDFNTIASSAMTLEFGPLIRTTPATDVPVMGFALQVGSNGQWHRHLGYTLVEPAPAGTYLLELELMHSGGLVPSAPFWVVFDQNRGGADLRRAIAWVRGNLAGECLADLDNGSGDGVPDGGVDINDLLYFLSAFESGGITADLDDGQGQGLPDEGVDINDLLFFLSRFEGGC